jgi:arylsulfatase A-like enzyme
MKFGKYTQSRWVRMPILGLVLACFGCRSSKSSEDHPTAAPTASASLDVAEQTTTVRSAAAKPINLLELLPACDIDHDGLMVDLGATTSATARGYGIEGSDSGERDQVIARVGSTFLPINDRRFRQDFWLDEAADELSIQARIAGRAASSVSLWVDNRRLGRQKLVRNEVSVKTFPRYPERLEAGRHVLMLESHGRSASPPEPWLEVDWLHFRRGSPQDGDDAAPTLRDIVADQEIDGVPRRSIVLRAASKVRCSFHLTGQTELNLALGYWGAGRGTAEIRLVEDGQSPITLHEHKVAGGNGARWTPITVDLSAYANRVVALELRAVSASQGGRVVFGEPRLIRPRAPAPLAIKAKTVVVIVASGLARKLVPPWGPIADRGTFVELRRESIAFDGYRVPTTVPAGVVASLLTGLSPKIHKVEDTAARLRHSTRTLSEMVKQAGGRTAMFTGVPTTFAAFGFNVSWDEYGSYSPVLDLPAETPIVEASRWLAREIDRNEGAVRFVFVHARGAHPPWDLTKEQTAQLEPPDYGGSLEARRAGITLGRIRRQTAKVQRRLNDEDLQRLRAFMGAAFTGQMNAVGQLIEVLKRRNAWEDTLFVFAGDTTNGELSAIPFDPQGSLREDQLSVPLLVKFPARLHAGKSFAGIVTSVDLTRTILDAVGLRLSEPIEGVNLLDSIADQESPQSRTLVATLGQRYVSRTGVWLLAGELSHAPRLCQTDVDPMCVEDHFERQPLAARSLWQWTATELSRLQVGGRSTQREPASIDPETAAALTVWGDAEM